jgi:hypothetical protein
MSNWRSTMRCFAFLALLTSVARAGDWPCFRGPGHQGESPEKNLPLRWDAATNVAWETAIPDSDRTEPLLHREVVSASPCELGTISAVGSIAKVCSASRARTFPG